MATMERNHSNREARRRRITERGADRLALITGGIKSQPLNPDESPSASCIADQNPTVYSLVSSVARYGDITTYTQPEDLSLPNHDCGELTQQNNADTPTEPLLSPGNTGKNIASALTAFRSKEKQVFPVSSSLQNPAMEHQHKDQSYQKSLTTSQIISAISASENIRICCSVAAAILVILSYVGFPILGWGIIRSTIFFRPFYLLLVTNVSYVFARLILSKPLAEVRPGQMNRVTTSSGEDGLFDQVGKALELAGLLQNVTGAIFMDFSIYAVVLICGLSLAGQLGR